MKLRLVLYIAIHFFNKTTTKISCGVCIVCIRLQNFLSSKHHHYQWFVKAYTTYYHTIQLCHLRFQSSNFPNFTMAGQHIDVILLSCD